MGNTTFIGMDGEGIYCSTDDGASWTAVNNELPPTLNVYALAISGDRLYTGSIYGVFVSEDQGVSWKQVNAGLLDVFVTALAVNGDKLVADCAAASLSARFQHSSCLFVELLRPGRSGRQVYANCIQEEVGAN